MVHFDMTVAHYTKKDIARFLNSYSDRVRRGYRITQSTSNYYQVKCPTEDCQFTVRFNKRSDGCFHATNFVEHNCEEKNYKPRRSTIVENIKEIQDTMPNITTKDCISLLKRQHGFEINYHTAYRSIKDLETQTKESVLNSHAKLSTFFTWNMIHNEGTHADILLEDQAFKACFICLNICAQVFSVSPPVIFLNSCHFKNDVLLRANGVDANNEIYPIAVGIVHFENEQSWTYFLSNLKRSLSLGDNKKLIIFSDRARGLTESIEETLPNARHSFCLYYLGREIEIRFRKSFSIELFKAASAPSFEEFLVAMETLRKRDSSVYEYLNEIPHENWAEYAIGRCRFGNLTSNITDSVSSSFLHPFEYLYRFINETYEMFRQRSAAYDDENGGILPKNFKEKIGPLIEEAKFLKLLRTDDTGVYRVGKDRSNIIFKIVDLNEKTCTCKFIVHNGFPCLHMLACIFSRGEELRDYLDDYFMVEPLATAYKKRFNFCDVECLDDMSLELPTQKRMKQE